MYIPWLAEFLLYFPPPKILRESRYRTLEFSQSAIQKSQTYKTEDNKAILCNIVRAINPETGEKFTKLDILTSTNTLMYISELKYLTFI
jgi:hypothetical protein